MSWYTIKSVHCPYVLNLRPLAVRGGKCGDLILENILPDDTENYRDRQKKACQVWQFDEKSRIVAKTGDALDVENLHTGGRNVIAKKPINGQNQKFKLEDDGYIVHLLTGLVLDVEGTSQCGAQLVLKEKGCGDCQQWELLDYCPIA